MLEIMNMDKRIKTQTMSGTKISALQLSGYSGVGWGGVEGRMYISVTWKNRQVATVSAE